MPDFVTVTDADIGDPAFWAGLNLTPESTIDISAVSDDVNVVLTGGAISFFDTASGTTTTYSDGDLASGSFASIVQFTGNGGDNDVSGANSLNGTGYTGGDGDDTLTDDGTTGGALTGGGGNDVLQGGSGGNQIDGGAGDDILRGGGGNNNLTGGAGNDTLFAEDGSGNLTGGEGDDTVYAGQNTTFTDGGTGSNTLILPEGATFEPFSPGSTSGNVTLADGRTFVYSNYDDISVACFTAGMAIRTPTGEVAVETLRPGDLVETRDHGARAIRWVGIRTVAGHGALTPIRFRTGAIGNTRSMRLSPQHRVLVDGPLCELHFGLPEVLCAARHLCDDDRIRPEPCDAVTYVHIMFDRHEIVTVDGAHLESFFVGDHITDADGGGYDELIRIFPDLARRDAPARIAARPFLKSYEGAMVGRSAAPGRPQTRAGAARAASVECDRPPRERAGDRV